MRLGCSLTVFRFNLISLALVPARKQFTGWKQINFHEAILLRARFVPKLLDNDYILSFNLPCFERSVSHDSSFFIQSSSLLVLQPRPHNYDVSWFLHQFRWWSCWSTNKSNFGERFNVQTLAKWSAGPTCRFCNKHRDLQKVSARQ